MNTDKRKQKRYEYENISLHVLSGMNLVEAYVQHDVLQNEDTVLKQYKTTSPQMFFNWMTCKQIVGMKTNNKLLPCCSSTTLNLCQTALQIIWFYQLS